MIKYNKCRVSLPHSFFCQIVRQFIKCEDISDCIKVSYIPQTRRYLLAASAKVITGHAACHGIIAPSKIARINLEITQNSGLIPRDKTILPYQWRFRGVIYVANYPVSVSWSPWHFFSCKNGITNHISLNKQLWPLINTATIYTRLSHHCRI